MPKLDNFNVSSESNIENKRFLEVYFCGLQGNYMECSTSLLSSLSHEFLKRFLIEEPSVKQIEIAKSFITEVIHSGKFVFDNKLTRREALCLYWAAQGKSSIETAEILHITSDTVNTHRKRILQKLNCKNISQAIYHGMKYAYVCPQVNSGLLNSEITHDKKSLFLRTIFS